MSAELYRWLEQRIAAAERSLTDQTGGTNVCRLQQDGRVTGGMKYDEGRLVALNTVRRQLVAAQQEGTAVDQRAMLAHEASEWREALRVQQARERPAIQWVAYRQGGVDALEELLAMIDSAG